MNLMTCSCSSCFLLYQAVTVLEEKAVLFLAHLAIVSKSYCYGESCRRTYDVNFKTTFVTLPLSDNLQTLHAY